ncbi:hypothetical protein ABIE41_001409 [Bosea sp. OAE506]|uniref:hypothetical protein n=1 Tax=Bosea sp. OAE506 TaxID=2663870 RepID=UPI00178BC00D
MRTLVLVAVAMLGFGSITPSTSQAATVAGLAAIEMPDHIEQIKKGGYKFKNDKGWKRNWSRGYGSSRYYSGPPPHARAYGRRARDFGYYRY